VVKNTSDGGGKKPKPSKGRKIHGEDSRLLKIFTWFTTRRDRPRP